MIFKPSLEAQLEQDAKRKKVLRLLSVVSFIMDTTLLVAVFFIHSTIGGWVYGFSGAAIVLLYQVWNHLYEQYRAKNTTTRQ